MVKITLLDKNHNTVAILDVDGEIVSSAACLIYKGRYYIYRGIEDGSFMFNEVNPPVDIGG